MTLFNRRIGFTHGGFLTMVAVSVMAGSSLLSLPHQAHAASFDCDAKVLQPDEKVICDNRALNDADVKMATTFDLLSGLLAMGSRGTLQDEQTAWLKKRQACAADAACIKTAYEERLKQFDETYKKINRQL
ncbi:hypothetical protein EV561_101161 [Rhizobium sp. BK376]|nr:hypothetical protein EV561_101161 [Rhizobium sp. BK376]